MSFIPRAWPPGLACSPGSHRWEHYPCSPNGTPEWALNLYFLIRSMKLSKSNDRRIRATVFTALRRAERGELTVVVKNSSPVSPHLGIRTRGQRCDSRLSSTASSSEHLKATQEPSTSHQRLTDSSDSETTVRFSRSAFRSHSSPAAIMHAGAEIGSVNFYPRVISSTTCSHKVAFTEVTYSASSPDTGATLPAPSNCGT